MCEMNTTSTGLNIREPIGDGILYPAEEGALRERVAYLLGSECARTGDAAAVITPHGALEYTGVLAASAFAASSERTVRTVVVLGPVHRRRSEGVFLSTFDRFQTPLGQITTSPTDVQRLLQYGFPFIREDAPHEEEHCIEVLLPFLQYLFPTADLVPLLVEIHSPKTLIACVEGLQLTFSDRDEYILYVVSSNLSSYLSGGMSKRKADAFVKLVLNRDEEGMRSAIKRREIDSCGAWCVAALLSLVDQNLQPCLLGRNESANIDGDKRKNVYYGAFSFGERSVSVNGVLPR